MTESFADILNYQCPRIDVLDIGAMLEEEGDRYAPLVAQGLAQVTGFEPNPTELARLAAAPGLTAICLCSSATAARRRFTSRAIRGALRCSSPIRPSSICSRPWAASQA